MNIPQAPCILVAHHCACSFSVTSAQSAFFPPQTKMYFISYTSMATKRALAHSSRLLSLQVNHSMQSYTLIIIIISHRTQSLHTSLLDWMAHIRPTRTRLYFKVRVDCTFISPGFARFAIVYQVEWTNPSTTATIPPVPVPFLHLKSSFSCALILQIMHPSHHHHCNIQFILVAFPSYSNRHFSIPHPR